MKWLDLKQHIEGHFFLPSSVCFLEFIESSAAETLSRIIKENIDDL